MSSGLRGVILAGGSGSRLSPITDTVNKHLVAVGRKPMLYHVVESLTRAGVVDILIVTGREHAGGVFQALGSGARFGAKFTFRVQEEAGGIADALTLARGFVEADPFVCLLGDNIFTVDFRPVFDRFHAEVFLPGRGPRGRILIKRVADPQRFGVAKFEGDSLARIVEKPSDPPSDFAVTGCYLFAGADSLFNLIAGLSRSDRGELEISDLLNVLLARGSLSHEEVGGEWSDAGTFESLKRAAEIVE